MPGNGIDKIAERMKRTLHLGGNTTQSGGDGAVRGAQGFTQAQREEIKKIVGGFLGQDPLDEDEDHPIGVVRVEELDKIPDIVRSLREFSGKPGEFGSWRKSVDRVLELFASIKGTSRYFAILHTIRTKIIGEADTALDSYRTPLDWTKIKKCLMMHYADKRDIGTLEYQMTTMFQGHRTITEFYQAVYQHLSLILDKVACLELDTTSLYAMTNAYREKALDTFIRGLRGDLPRLLSVREPSSLPQALHMCLKLDNMSYRINHAHGQIQKGGIPKNPIPQQGVKSNFYPELAYVGGLHRPPIPPRVIHRQPYNSLHQFQNRIYHNQNRNMNQNPNMRPQFVPQNNSYAVQEPMDVDRSIQTKQVNYANRPPFNPAYKRPLGGSFQGPAHKVQRNFHLGTENNHEEKRSLNLVPQYINRYEQTKDAEEGLLDLTEYSKVIKDEGIEDWTVYHGVKEPDDALGAYSVEDLNADLNFFG